MSDEEMAENIGYAIENTKHELSERLVNLVKERIESERLLCETSLVVTIEKSDVIRRVIREYFEKWVANEIGNRLRCGIYDGLQIDKLFESIWNEQLDTAIKDRIRSRVYTAIDAVIAERLKTFKV